MKMEGRTLLGLVPVPRLNVSISRTAGRYEKAKDDLHVPISVLVSYSRLCCIYRRTAIARTKIRN